jgi:hypothetical protein
VDGSLLVSMVVAKGWGSFGNFLKEKNEVCCID